MANELESISPAEAKKMYLRARAKPRKVRSTAITTTSTPSSAGVKVAGLENMNNLTGRKLQQFRTWRREDGDLKPITLEGNLDALRTFIRWCESTDAVPNGLHDKIIMPVLKKSDERSEAILTPDHAEYLRRFERTRDW